MAEQPRRVQVLARCKKCDRRYNQQPILAVVDRRPGEPWKVDVVVRTGRRGDLPGLHRKGAAPDGPLLRPDQVVEPQGAIRLAMTPVTGSAAQMACQRDNCGAKPRAARAWLIEQAEQAIAEGRAEFLV